MVRIGGFLKTQNRIRLQRARGRFISPYQKGGTIFGQYPESVQWARTMARAIARAKARKKTMKGGTIFGQYPESVQWARTMARANARAKARKKTMEGGTIFGKSTLMRMRNPMRFASATSENEMIERWVKQRMKGGTIFGKSTRMRYPWMIPSTYQEDPNWLLTMARRETL